MANFAILFLGVYAWGVISALFLNAVWAFYLYQLVYFFYPDGRWWGQQIPDIKYSFIVSALLLFTFCIRYKDYTQNKIFSVPQAKWMVALLIVYALVSFVAVNPIAHEQALIALLKMFVILYVGFKVIDTVAKLDIALWVFIIGATYIGMEANRVGRNGQGRVEGIGTIDSPDSNGAAAVIAPTLVLLIFYLWQGANKKIKFAALFCGAIVANGIVLINSRGSFVGIVCGAGYFLAVMFFGKIQQNNQKATAVLVVLISLGGALYVTDDLFWERMFTITSEDEGESGSHRTHMWMSAVDLASDYPFGVGAYGFQKLSPNYVSPELFFRGQPTKAVHSSWFQALSEIGWLGLIIFLSLLVSCFLQTRKLKKMPHIQKNAYLYYQIVAIEAALVTYLGAATFIDQYRTEVLYWLVLFTACVSQINLRSFSQKSVIKQG